MIAARRPSMATYIGDLPCAPSSACCECRDVHAQLAHEAIGTDLHPSTLDTGPHAHAGDRFEIDQRWQHDALPGRGVNNRAGNRMLRARFHRGNRRQYRARNRRQRPDRSRGRPSVSVPVLSTATTCASFSCNASPLRNSTPISAPRPVPTMIEVGVASPIAQGQAMISTATALTSAKLSAGDGPKINQTTGRQRGQHHRGHEPQRHLVDHRLDRQLRALRLFHHADDLRQHLRHRRGAHRQCARLVDGAADHAAAGLLLDRRLAS